MIDTKKYEGHTPWPWVYFHEKQQSGSLILFFHTVRQKNLNETKGNIIRIAGGKASAEADCNLIADAPMLLESLITAEARIKELEEALKEKENLSRFCDYARSDSTFIPPGPR